MKNILILSFLMICISLQAQVNQPDVTPTEPMFQAKLTGERFVPDTIIGSSDQFLDKYWSESDILLSTGDWVHGEKIKYNGFQDEVIWLNVPNFKPYRLDRSSISDFWLKNEQDSTVHFRRVNVRDTTAGNRADLFVQVVVEGKYSLYIQRKVSNMVTDLVGYAYIPVYERTPVYYIKLTSNIYLKMGKLNRRSFLNLFPEQKSALRKLIRKNHLNLKKEDGLIRTLVLMNNGLLE